MRGLKDKCFLTYLTYIKTSEEKQEGDIFKRRGWKMSQGIQRKAKKTWWQGENIWVRRTDQQTTTKG